MSDHLPLLGRAFVQCDVCGRSCKDVCNVCDWCDAVLCATHSQIYGAPTETASGPEGNPVILCPDCFEEASR